MPNTRWTNKKPKEALGTIEKPVWATKKAASVTTKLG